MRPFEFLPPPIAVVTPSAAPAAAPPATQSAVWGAEAAAGPGVPLEEVVEGKPLPPKPPNPDPPHPFPHTLILKTCTLNPKLQTLNPKS